MSGEKNFFVAEARTGLYSWTLANSWGLKKKKWLEGHLRCRTIFRTHNMQTDGSWLHWCSFFVRSFARDSGWIEAVPMIAHLSVNGIRLCFVCTTTGNRVHAFFSLIGMVCTLCAVLAFIDFRRRTFRGTRKTSRTQTHIYTHHTHTHFFFTEKKKTKWVESTTNLHLAVPYQSNSPSRAMQWVPID